MLFLVEQMNQVVSYWNAKFGLYYTVPMLFSSDEQGHLCFNGLTLSSANTLVLVSAQYDALTIRFFFDNSPNIAIHIDWPEDSTPQVAAVSFELLGSNT